jgi:hypothetical protein
MDFSRFKQHRNGMEGTQDSTIDKLADFEPWNMEFVWGWYGGSSWFNQRNIDGIVDFSLIKQQHGWRKATVLEWIGSPTIWAWPYGSDLPYHLYIYISIFCSTNMMNTEHIVAVSCDWMDGYMIHGWWESVLIWADYVLLSSILCWDDRNYGWLVVHPIPTKKNHWPSSFFTGEHVITWLVVLTCFNHLEKYESQ